MIIFKSIYFCMLMFKMIEGGIIEDKLDIDTLIHSGGRWYFIIRLSTIEKS